IAQTLALAQGWQEANTLCALERAAEMGVLPKPEGEKLLENYRKLRRIEGILRRWSFEGETVLPADPAPLYRVAVRCGFLDGEQLLKAVGSYRAAIAEVYERVFA